MPRWKVKKTKTAPTKKRGKIARPKPTKLKRGQTYS